MSTNLLLNFQFFEHRIYEREPSDREFGAICDQGLAVKASRLWNLMGLWFGTILRQCMLAFSFGYARASNDLFSRVYKGPFFEFFLSARGPYNSWLPSNFIWFDTPHTSFMRWFMTQVSVSNFTVSFAVCWLIFHAQERSLSNSDLACLPTVIRTWHREIANNCAIVFGWITIVISGRILQFAMNNTGSW